MVIQTILLDPSGAVWSDSTSNVSRLDPSGTVQVDAEHPTRNRRSSGRICVGKLGSVGSWSGCGASGGSAPQWAPRIEPGEVEVETWDAIRSRRNVRTYSEEAIAPEDLDRILEAARRAPSAGNQQAWDFIVSTDREQLARLTRVGPAAGHVAGSAATIALVAPRSDDPQMRDLVQFDLGQATMSIMLAAADLGIGSAHAGAHDQELARRLLGVPEDRFCAVLVTLGVPADRPLTPIQRPNRRPFNDVVHRGHW
jgi:nitroreductase